MKITYLYHSCFIVELERHILLFDYYKGKLPIFDASKTLYVFVSHAHHDHFQASIFSISHPHMYYILSDDVPTNIVKNMQMVHSHEAYQIEDLRITTLASTDQGVAFLIEVEQCCIYHAGDLHWWDWQEEDTIEESEDMRKHYQEEIGLIDKHVDIAFVPVDPRLNEAYAKGIDYFMTHVSCSYVFPMHFENHFEIVEKLRNATITKQYRDKIVNIAKSNQEFLIEL